MKWRRILIWCGIAFAAIIVYAVFFGVATMFAVEARWLGRKDPTLWKTPVVLADVSASTSEGLRLSYFGYQFEVPWNDIDESRTKLIGKWQAIGFRSRKEIIFLTAPPRQFVDGVLPSSKIDREKLNAILGSGSVQSDYTFIRDALYTTPGKITLTTPRTDAVAVYLRLVFKLAVMLDADSGGVFLIDGNGFRGFQYGDPAAEQSQIVDDLFSEKGKVEFRFVRTKDTPKFSQAEINRVIQTLRIAPVTPAP